MTAYEPSASGWPLDGVRVLDLTSNVAGPYASMILAELGANVIKVERQGRGDDTRAWGPPFWNGESTIYLALNRNKKSITLNFEHPDSTDVLERLVARSDILLESFRPGVLERKGWSFEWAKGINPRLVYCSVTPFGQSGPLRDLPGYDPMMQAFGGLMAVTGTPDGSPVRIGVSIIDMATGMWAALSIVSALLRRQRTGQGERVVVALYETALAWMAYHLETFWASGVLPGRHGSGTFAMVPYGAFATIDGHLVIAAPNDMLFKQLCSVLGDPELADDMKFRTNPDRVAHRDELNHIVEAMTVLKTSKELKVALDNAGIPSAAVRDVGQVAEDEQAAALGIFQLIRHPALGEIRSVGMPFTLGGQRPLLRMPPPRLGEHNLEVFMDLGYSPDRMQGLTSSNQGDQSPGRRGHSGG
jgi:crotonobetainyl-CoA:carnitine CoA-transferase CaiB-like acyl-CoA transferase